MNFAAQVRSHKLDLSTAVCSPCTWYQPECGHREASEMGQNETCICLPAAKHRTSLQLSSSKHRVFTQSLNKRIEGVISASTRVAVPHRDRDQSSGAKVADDESRSTNADGHAEFRVGMCRRGPAGCLVTEPKDTWPSTVGDRPHHRRRRYSFTDARVYFASAGLAGSRRHFATVPVKLNMEGGADHRLEARAVRPCARTGGRGSSGWCPRLAERHGLAFAHDWCRLYPGYRDDVMARSRSGCLRAGPWSSCRRCTLRPC